MLFSQKRGGKTNIHHLPEMLYSISFRQINCTKSTRANYTNTPLKLQPSTIILCPPLQCYLGCWIIRGLTFTLTILGAFSQYLGPTIPERGPLHFSAPTFTISILLFAPFSAPSFAPKKKFTNQPHNNKNAKKKKLTYLGRTIYTGGRASRRRRWRDRKYRESRGRIQRAPRRSTRGSSSRGTKGRTWRGPTNRRRSPRRRGRPSARTGRRTDSEWTALISLKLRPLPLPLYYIFLCLALFDDDIEWEDWGWIYSLLGDLNGLELGDNYGHGQVVLFVYMV